MKIYIGLLFCMNILFAGSRGWNPCVLYNNQHALKIQIYGPDAGIAEFQNEPIPKKIGLDWIIFQHGNTENMEYRIKLTFSGDGKSVSLGCGLWADYIRIAAIGGAGFTAKTISMLASPVSICKSAFRPPIKEVLGPLSNIFSDSAEIGKAIGLGMVACVPTILGAVSGGILGGVLGSVVGPVRGAFHAFNTSDKVIIQSNTDGVKWVTIKTIPEAEVSAIVDLVEVIIRAWHDYATEKEKTILGRLLGWGKVVILARLESHFAQLLENESYKSAMVELFAGLRQTGEV